jgi:beta-1,2-mannobiose phosphorylase / 1,2-beta-oligomannan phosphorylase
MLRRIDANPILTPADLSATRPDLEVMCTLNPAAIRFGGQTLLLVRVGERAQPEPGKVAYVRFNPEQGQAVVEQISLDHPDLDTDDPRGYYLQGKMLLTSMSHLRIARSDDGVHFTFDAEPAIYPSTPYEAYGCEDPRITCIDGRYYITYTAVSDRGVTVALASTSDFTTFDRHGIIFPPYQKDVVLFPQRIGGMYVARHRPYMNEFNDASIWTAFSPDLHCWGHHSMTLAPTPETWESGRVGAGGVPIGTEAGWLELYHAADSTGRYALGAMLSDLDHPERIITRSREPIFTPQADYETRGVYGNCVFTNGMVADETGRVVVYYGAADLICAAAETTLDEMIAAARNERD